MAPATLAAKLQALKTSSLAAARALALPVLRADGVRLGQLVPVGPWVFELPGLVADISAWRQRAMRMFLTQFTATPENTADYLRRLSIGQPDRLLFLIDDGQGRWVGHVGLSGIGAHGAELDNLMRGVEGGDPQLIPCAEAGLLRWAFSQLGLAEVDVRLVSYNWLVATLHEDIGFETSAQQPLFKRLQDGVVTHEECTASQANVRYTCTHMRLSRARFLALNPAPALPPG